MKAIEIDSKIPNTSSFITTPELNRLTKISFDERTKEAEWSLGSKTKLNNPLDLGDKNKKTKNKSFRHLIQLFQNTYKK